MGLGARVVEKHFVISKKRQGPDTICSMDKDEFKQLIHSSKIINDSLSSDKDIIPQENITRRFAFHSVVSKKEINKNEILSRKNLTTKRPGTGDFPAYKIKSLYGIKAKRKIKKNRLIKKNDIK